MYRNLESLERHGMVRHVHLGPRAGALRASRAREAEYLYCERCGEVVAVDAAELDRCVARSAASSGYHARFTHFAIVGLCQRCAAEAQ